MDETSRASSSRRHLANFGLPHFSFAPASSHGPSRPPADGKTSPASGLRSLGSRSSFSTTAESSSGYPPVNMPSHPKPGNLGSASSSSSSASYSPYTGPPGYSSPPSSASSQPQQQQQ